MTCSHAENDGISAHSCLPDIVILGNRNWVLEFGKALLFLSLESPCKETDGMNMCALSIMC